MNKINNYKVVIYIFIFIQIFNCKIAFSNNIDIINKKKFDIIANVNELAITKYDLDNLIRVYYGKNMAKNKLTNGLYNEILNNYIDILKKRIIVLNSNVTLDEIEKKSLWDVFYKNFKVKNNVSLEDFCKKNLIDKDLFLFFLESNYLWLKYVEINIKPKVKVENYINDVSDYMAKTDKIVRYNLSEIVLYYNDLENKKEILNKINSIYKLLNNKNFDTIAFSMSQSISAKNNGLIGWVYENELSEIVLNNIKNLNINTFSKPFCIGNDNGSCIIFKINNKEDIINQSEDTKNGIMNYIFGQVLENNIRNILNSNKNKIKVIYK